MSTSRFHSTSFLVIKAEVEESLRIARNGTRKSGNVTLRSIKAFAGIRREISTLVEMKYDKT